LHLREDRHPRGQLQGLAGQAVRPVAGLARLDVTAATTNAAAARTCTGVAGTFLAVHLASRPGRLAARLRLDRTLTEVGLVHHDGVVQQLLADPRSEFTRIDFVGADLIAAAVVYLQTDHGFTEYVDKALSVACVLAGCVMHLGRAT